MLKKTITFIDFNDKEVSEDHFFHLSKADLVELEVGHDGGLSNALQEIVNSNDGKRIILEFKKLILAAYGTKSDDGRRFIKTDGLREEFASSEAYSTLFMELVTDADKAAEFVNGIVPQGMDTQVGSNVFKDGPHVPDPVAAHPPNAALHTPSPLPGPQEDPPAEQPRVLTRAEISEMDQTQLSHLLATGKAVIGSEG